MKTNSKYEVGIVVEIYDHDSTHRIMTVRSKDVLNHHFFYLGMTPIIDFGDEVEMNFEKEEYSVCRGNSKLTYKINLLPFPGSLLWELISERMNL